MKGGGTDLMHFTPIPGEMIQFDEHIIHMGWFNHQLDLHIHLRYFPDVSLKLHFPVYLEVQVGDESLLWNPVDG